MEQDLAEKRRLAPGWLDRSEKILEPERKGSIGSPAAINDQAKRASIMDSDIESNKTQPTSQEVQDPAGDELDRAFGGMTVRKE